MDLDSLEHVGYLTLFLLLLGGAIGFPIPEDLPLIAAGVLSQSDHLDPLAAFIVCYSGILVGDLIIFTIGRSLGPSIFERSWFQRRVSPARIRLLRNKLSKRSVLTIFVARHLFYLRSITFLTCGAVKMSYAKFIAADSIAALVSAPLMMSIGYFAAEHSENIAKNLQIGLIAIAVLAIAVYFLLRKKKKQGKRSRRALTQ